MSNYIGMIGVCFFVVIVFIVAIWRIFQDAADDDQ